MESFRLKLQISLSLLLSSLPPNIKISLLFVARAHPVLGLGTSVSNIYYSVYPLLPLKTVY